MSSACAHPRWFSDAELVALATEGDKRAFGELVLRHRGMVELLAARMLGDPDVARDAAQEAILVALVSLHRLRSPERFGSWLCGIGLNVARRWLRDCQAFVPSVDIETPDQTPGPDETAEVAMLGERVRCAVGALAPGQREAVWLFYLQGLSHREVAAELGITIGAVKARLHQARQALAPRLAAEIEEVPMTAEIPAGPASWVDVSVAEVRASGDDPSRRLHVVVLEDARGRQLPIWIGSPEAMALAVSLESEEMPRPMTFQFTAGLLDAAGTTAAEVRVTRLVEGIYYAVVVLKGPAGRHEVDARPSDALNLAVVTGAPIRVDARLLDHSDLPESRKWRQYPRSAADLVDEVRRRQQEGLDRVARECSRDPK